MTTYSIRYLWGRTKSDAAAVRKVWATFLQECWPPALVPPDFIRPGSWTYNLFSGIAHRHKANPRLFNCEMTIVLGREGAERAVLSLFNTLEARLLGQYNYCCSYEHTSDSIRVSITLLLLRNRQC